MARWYYSVGGKAEGPVSQEFLVEGLKAGRFTLVDLVFREGDSAWCTLGEIPEFREAFQAPPAPVAPAKAIAPHASEADFESSEVKAKASFQSFRESSDFPAWVVLKKSGSGFEQTGPFSAEQIIQGLATGEFEYSQYAWKSGYKRWVRIGNLPEFDRRKRDRDGDPVNQIIPLPDSGEPFPALSQEELMENVVRFERTMVMPLSALATDSPPDESDGVDLVSKDDFSIVLVNPIAAAQPPSVKAELKDERVDDEDEDEDEDEDDVTEIPHLTKSDEGNSRAPSAPTRSVPHSRATPPPVSADDEIDDEDLTPTQAGVSLPGDSQSGIFVSSIQKAAGVPETHAHEAHATGAHAQGEEVEPLQLAEENSAEEGAPKRFRSPMWKRAARLFVAGAAAGVLVIVALPYLTSSTDEAADGSSEQGPADSATEADEASTATNESKSAEAQADDPAPGSAPAVAVQAQDPNAVAAAPGAMESQSGAPVAVAPAAPEPPPKAAPVVPEALAGIHPVPPGTGAPSSLDLVPVKLSSSTPYLVVQTNASVGQKIWVRLKARSGEILRLPSYDRTISFVRSADDIPALDLAKLGLPQGSYRVDVAVGDLRKSSQIFVGAKNADFDKEMENHLKELAFQQQSEKKTLFYTAKRFEALAKSLSDSFQKNHAQTSKWRAFYASWKKDVKSASAPLTSLARSSGSGVYAYPDEVKSLKAAVDSLNEQGRMLDTAVQQRRDVASQKPLAIIREFSRIRQEVAQISARR